MCNVRCVTGSEQLLPAASLGACGDRPWLLPATGEAVSPSGQQRPVAAATGGARVSVPTLVLTVH